MARIRSIKPEFCTSEQVVDCSPTARLLFVLMWCFCDDAGRHLGNVKRLKMEVFPGDPFTDKQIRGFIDELIRAKLLLEYKFDGHSFWQVTGWKKHQKIEKPSYKYGPFDEKGNPLFVDQSSNGRRSVDDSSPPEWSGEEGSGVERSGEEDSGIDDKSSTPQAYPLSDYTEFAFSVCDGSEWLLTTKKLSEYRRSFPELDIERELRKAAQWLLDNPKRRKTARGMAGFLGSWLSRAQDSGRAFAGGEPTTYAQQRIKNTQQAIEDFVNG